MSVVVIEPRKGKSVASEGALLKQKFTKEFNETKLMANNQQKVGAAEQLEMFKRRGQEIPDAERVETLTSKLYQKAKHEKSFKFYVLYDKMFIPYMLREAWKQVKSNGGAAGVDGKTITDIESYGVTAYLQELGEDLRKRTYKPMAVKRVMIPKANGGERPLGIPVIRDRIAQTVCKMILEPIYEADFEESSYGFRPHRSSKDAMKEIKEHLKSGKTEIVDADLSKYFDTIPHDKLMLTLKERITDPRMLALIQAWLKAPVQEKGGFSGGKKSKVGTPQGGVISPLLANVYLHLLDRIVNNTNSMFSKMGVKIVRYADDFVLMGRDIPDAIMVKLKTLLSRMGLTLNESKTARINAREETFNFLGHTIRYSKGLYVAGTRYWEIMPSKKSEKKVREKLNLYLIKHRHSPAKEIANGLNPIIRGWLNYFEIEGVSYVKTSKNRLRFYLTERLRIFYKKKSQRKSRVYRQNAFEILVDNYGLLDPRKYSIRPSKL